MLFDPDWYALPKSQWFSRPIVKYAVEAAWTNGRAVPERDGFVEAGDAQEFLQWTDVCSARGCVGARGHPLREVAGVFNTLPEGGGGGLAFEGDGGICCAVLDDGGELIGVVGFPLA